jgi:LuxR family maltose regulon positive regulatory protein
MPDPLLESKFFLPRHLPKLVDRPHLRQRLDEGSVNKLLLVSAPAGFGKTTLLVDWLATLRAGAENAWSVAWLSLGRADNDPTVFWTYVITALSNATPGIGARELALLASSPPPPIHQLLTTLLNDVGATGGDLLLVLDDYHLVDHAEVQDSMVFLLDRMPARLHVVLSTRADPAMPLARLRGRGELAEIRAADLRFTPEEAASYLNGVMDLHLTVTDIADLDDRTEGWIAALQLAALSMRGREDKSGFIAGFAGNDRYIVDYLAEEVLHRQPPSIRNFLLQTSFLGRFTGSLCDAVTGTAGGTGTLEALDRGNLFLVPLDDRRQWYRYHHLFADVLRARLADESPGLVPLLHRRACDWFAEHGHTAEAIGHALDARAFDRAADLVELAMPQSQRDRQESTLRGWLELLPPDVLAVRPALSNGYAGALLATGQIDGVDDQLRSAEHWLDPHDGPRPDQTRMVVVDKTEFRRLPAAVAVHRAGLALAQGDPSATLTHARRALTLLEPEDHLARAAATALMGLSSWWSGDLDTAREGYTTSLTSMRRAGHLADVLGLSIALADILITQGRLREALRTYERAEQLTPEHATSPLRGTADMYVGLSTVCCERNDLGTASAFLIRSTELGEHLGLPQNQYRWCVAMARIRQAQGDLVEAVTLLDEAERRYVGDFSPNVRPVSALRARVWTVQGRTSDALDWARSEGLSAEDDLSYVREHEHVTLARALLARHETDPDEPSLHDAAALLQRLLHAAEAGHRGGTVIEILVLQARAAQLRDDTQAALVPLGRALALAEPEGYVQTFLDEGPPMAALLAVAAQHGVAPAYVARLRAAFPAPAQPGRPAAQPLVDPLSPRELEVLRLLGTELTGPEIAERLVVSLNTVRTHTKSIYAKLEVTSRRAAVRRGNELDLVTNSRTRHR